jgi:hypothetical protein
MIWALPLLIILGGMLAAAGLIVSKKPDAKELIAKIQPYQAIIGIILLVDGLYELLLHGGFHAFQMLGAFPLLALTAIGMMFSAILLGILFGMPMLAKLSASGAAKGEELGKKLAPFQTIIGIVGLVSGLLGVLYNLGILKVG